MWWLVCTNIYIVQESQGKENFILGTSLQFLPHPHPPTSHTDTHMHAYAHVYAHAHAHNTHVLLMDSKDYLPGVEADAISDSINWSTNGFYLVIQHMQTT